ncbi:MAG: cytochrome c oxidase subunit 3 [Flavobacteriaceae bacterium]|nr:cytochrome oxidase subunit III [Flavobacteriaceae bacterium]|tara:strand:+ start:2099 stop:3079 length:981 start_codon:yes stop_codon:yes gene_type:complete
MRATTDIVENETVWSGGNKPLNASYGKMMMWFFIVSDALTFSGFLVAYGFSRFKNIDSWPIADEVFYHFPFLHGIDAPMYYVALMTFILIFSSVTMVLAVDAGHKMEKTKVAIYMLLTIIGGAIFVGSQAWEWKNFIHGEYGAVETRGGQILQFVNNDSGERVTLESFASTLPTDRSQHTGDEGLWFVSESALPTYSVAEVQEGFLANPDLLIKTEMIDAVTGHKIVLDRESSELKILQAMYVVEGANLVRNEYGNRLFADFFFFITGFHGFHVFSGVVINCIIFFNVLMGTYERRGHYEMVEKVGLYWHFVDLVWVFVFTFFYLV